MNAVYRKELKTYFTGMTGAIFIGFVLLITGIFTSYYNLRGMYPSFELVVAGVSFIYMLVVPIITMRSVAEEKHSRTDQLLYSLPISVTDVVLAKYFAMLTVLAVPCAVMAFYPLILASFGTVHFSTAYSALLAFFLLGAALIAIGMFISSLTESQVIAAVISLGVMVLINFMSAISNMISESALASLIGCIMIALITALVAQSLIKNLTVSVCLFAALGAGCVIVYMIDKSLFEGLIPSLLSSLAMFDRLSTFQSGIFDMTAVIFYVSVAVLFVYLTVQSMEKKRWN